MKPSIRCPSCGLKLRPGTPHAPAYCQYRQATTKPRKYRNKPVDILDEKGQVVRSVASGLEYRTNGIMLIRQKQGDITNLRFQVPVFLGPAKRRWVMDYAFDVAGEPHFGDAKGFETDRWKHLLDLWVLAGPGPLEVWKADSRGEPALVATIVPAPQMHAPESQETNQAATSSALDFSGRP